MRTVAALLCIAFTLPALAGVVGWRGDGSNAYPTAAPQTAWGPGEGVRWATELPAWSNACPVPVGDRIFLCAEPSTLLCLDRDGKILWQRTNNYDDFLTADERAKLAAERVQLAPLEQRERPLRGELRAKQKQATDAEKAVKEKPDDEALKAAAAQAKTQLDAVQAQLNEIQQQKAKLALAMQYSLPPTHQVNGYTSDTPVSDGNSVFVSFGSGVVACYGLDGTRKWGRLYEKPQHGWGHSASPLLVGGKLLVSFLGLIAIDPGTGRELWRQKLPSKDWGTPAVATLGTRHVVLTDSGAVVDVADGAILGNTGLRLEYGSPLIIGDTAYCASGNTAAAFQFAIADDHKLQITKRWQTEVAKDRYYASPLLVDGLLYFVNQAGVLSVLDAKTGDKAYEQKLGLGGTMYPSPVLNGNIIIIASENGKVVILTPGRTYAEVARLSMDPFRTTPVFVGTRMYIRTTPSPARTSKLYCFER